jgi:hypothetical protein
MFVFGPLLEIMNNCTPNGVRKIEARIAIEDLEQFKLTLANHNKQSRL